MKVSGVRILDSGHDQCYVHEDNGHYQGTHANS